MKVREIMTSEVASVAADEPLKAAAQLLSERRVSGAPVVDRTGRAVGVISEADIVSRLGASKGKGGFLRRLVSRPRRRRRRPTR